MSGAVRYLGKRGAHSSRAAGGAGRVMNPINAVGETAVDLLVCGPGMHTPPSRDLLRTPWRPPVSVVADASDDVRFTRAALQAPNTRRRGTWWSTPRTCTENARYGTTCARSSGKVHRWASWVRKGCHYL